jgi:soluble lytic murein transglycosylase
MQKREEDELLRLRPRYWAARSVEAAGDEARARKEFEILATDWRMSYYGWRAQQRLGEFDLIAKGVANVAAPGAASRIEASRLQRVALLLEADLKEMALHEIQSLLPQARSLSDRIRVGRLLANAGDYYRAQLLVVEAYSPLLGKGLRPGYEPLFWLGWPPAYREFVEASLPLSGRVEPALVWAIMREESGFRPQVMSSAGARGLLQLMPETARRTAGRVGLAEFEDPEALFYPAPNIALGSAYLDHLAGRFPTRLSAVIGSYNAGPTAVSQWLEGASGELEDDIWVEDIPYSQTRSYVKRVLRSLHVYRNFY